MASRWNCKFGILLVKRDLKLSPAVIIKVHTVLLSPTTLLTENLSPRSQSGWARSTSMLKKIFPEFSLVTRRIWRTKDKFLTKRPRSLLITLTSDSWRPRLRNPWMSRSHSPSWPVRLRERLPLPPQREMLKLVALKSAKADQKRSKVKRADAADYSKRVILFSTRTTCINSFLRGLK